MEINVLQARPLLALSEAVLWYQKMVEDETIVVDQAAATKEIIDAEATIKAAIKNCRAHFETEADIEAALGDLKTFADEGKPRATIFTSNKKAKTLV